MNIPKILLYCRLVIAVVIFFLALLGFTHLNKLVFGLMITGVLSDIFDGIIARNQQKSTQKLRILDTIFDLFFYLSVFYYVAKTNPQIIFDNPLIIAFLLGLELLMYLTSLIKFKKLPSPHAILSKFWGLYLIIEFSLILWGISGNHFKIALFIGLIPHLDRVLIYLFLRKWSNDIPSSYHAYLLRKGIPIKRYKLFNG